MKKVPISSTVPESVDKVYKDWAKKLMVSKSALVRRVLVDHATKGSKAGSVKRFLTTT